MVIATPWDGATQTAVSVEDKLRGKVVISMANALTRLGKEFQPLVPPRGSVAASVQAAVPQCMVAAAFHHVPARELGDLTHPIESDVLICSDHPSAIQVTSDIVAKIPNMRPLNAGELAMATPIESFTAVLLQLNMRYKTRVAVKLTGIREASLGEPPSGAAAEAPGRETTRAERAPRRDLRRGPRRAHAALRHGARRGRRRSHRGRW